MSTRIHAYYKGEGWWGTVMRIFHDGDDIPETIVHNEQICYRVDRPGAAGVVGVGYHWDNHESNALGCPPSQAAEMEQVAIRQGVPTEYDRKTGKAKIKSRKHLNDLCRAKGIVNFDGGMNDFTGSSTPVTESNFT